MQWLGVPRLGRLLALLLPQRCPRAPSPGAVNRVLFVFLIHPFLPFVPTQVFLLSLIFSELTLVFLNVSGKLRSF